MAELFEALGAERGVPVLSFGLLLVFVCKATFQQRLHLAFWLLDRWAACALQVLYDRLPAEQL